MSILDAFKKKESFEVIHHVVLVEAPFDVVCARLMTLADNPWRSTGKLKFKALSSNGMKEGAQWEGSFKSLLLIRWRAKVNQFTPSIRAQSALTGFFKGTETLSAEERFNVIKVEFHWAYEITNPFNQLFWSLLAEEDFIKETRRMMDAFKAQCEKAK